VWKRVEALERNSLSASYLSHFIPQKELPIDVEAGVGFEASLVVFLGRRKVWQLPEIELQIPILTIFPLSPHQ